MTSDAIFDLVERIAATSSKTAKQELIAAHKDDEHFVRVLEAALNPFKTYGLAKRPEAVEFNDRREFTEENTWNILEGLRTRTMTGNFGREMVAGELGRLTPKSAELFWRIISKDLRAGFSESTVNKAIPGTIPTFDCMLAHPFEADRVKKWPVVAEPKLDGVRVLAFVDISEPSVKFFSRSGKEFTTFDHLKEPLIEIVDSHRHRLTASAGNPDADARYFADRLDCEEFALVFDGEIVSGSFNKTVSEVRKKDVQATDAIFNVFDILPMSLFSKDDKVPSKHTYTERRAVLTDLLGHYPKNHCVQLLPRYLVSSVEEIHSLYESVRARGLEGLIVKHPDAPYYRRRNHAWMKLKAEETVDVKIIGIEPGTGKYEGMIGALVVDFNSVRVNVGSGLSDNMRGEDHDLFMGRLIEVEYHEVTPDGSLRHPRFKRFRDDKA